MSTRKKPSHTSNFIGRLSRKIWRFFNSITNAFITWFLRSVLVVQRRTQLSQTGFVLPTVVMVILVVILLTTAILFRSFDRSKNASNYRVDEAVLRAATPALDRARAKINYLFSPAETGLQGNTPSETNIASVLEGDTYTLGDETRVKLQDIPTSGVNVPALASAWKFPVDTDNNGQFDSFTLYGIYYRTPPLDNQGNDTRRRTPLEARALPQQTGGAANCAPGSGAAGAEPGWVPINGQLKKAFFTYVATVPITQPITTPQNKIPAAKFETYKGNKGFSALEMQVDQARIALDNNAVWYEDDLEIAYVPTFNLNGRIHTNSNLMVTSPGPLIKLHQVSSPDSCFYDPVNAKIIVGGNVAAGTITDATDTANPPIEVDLYPGKTPPTQFPAISSANKTTTNNPPQVAANTTVFEQRLKVLTQGALNKYLQRYPNPNVAVSLARVQTVFPNINKPDDYEADISRDFKSKCPSDACSTDILERVLDTYFRRRIRRVSYSEISFDDLRTNPEKARQDAGGRTLSPNITPPAGETYVFAGLPGVAPPVDWMVIDPGYTKLNLKVAGGTMDLAANRPRGNSQAETLIGDRIKVGNNLPQQWLTNTTNNPPEYAKLNEPQEVVNVNWNDGGQRTRQGLAQPLDDLGDTSRGGYWEKAAAKTQDLIARDPNSAALLGGLRVVTGGGIYIDGLPAAAGGTGRRYAPGLTGIQQRQVKSFLPEPPVTATELKALYPQAGIQDTGVNQARVVWPDTMPMYLWKPRNSGDPIATITDKIPPNILNAGEGLKGDLQMRATVVYHYQDNPTATDHKDDEPIACISSYYDPTDAVNASNAQGLPLSTERLGASNNGVNYPPPSPGNRRPSPRLRRQANMIFPDGRWANPALRTAIQNFDRSKPLTVADIAAFDAANCALSILDNPTGFTPVAAGTPGKVADGAIKERTFLDARQVKALHKATVETDDKGNPIINPSTSLPVEIDDRTPLADIASPERTKIAELLSSKTNIASITEPLPDRYTLPIEQRQPLEIRVTEIDLNQLRQTPIGGNTGGGYPNNNQEYLLPNSGVIYATREDGLEDISDVDRVNANVGDNGGSATDFKLDPTRRPNGIRLINGVNLARDNQFRTAEKGLILASNLPVYIQGEFNLHYEAGGTNLVEEFTTLLFPDSGNFYGRGTNKNLNFACRADQKAGCNTGDQWRPARILSDAVTLLSSSFRDGYRNDGNYDLNNNAGNWAVKARLKNGFWWNSFATSAQWYETTGQRLPKDFDPTATGKQTSSYVTNSVTPIQRRANFPVYKMEICRKLPVSECGPNDWVADNTSGTTAALAPRPADQRYPRRVAFARDPKFHQLQLEPDSSTPPNPELYYAIPKIPGGGGAGVPRSYSVAGAPPPKDNALWFWTSTTPNAPYDRTTFNATTKGIDPNSGIGYNNTNPLYYLPDEPELPTAWAPVVHERQLLLPGTPEFPAPNTPEAPPGMVAIPPLNGETAADLSDFAVCTTAGSSKDYQVAALSGTCPVGRAKVTWARLRQLPTTDTALPTIPGSGSVLVTATGKVNVYQLPANGQLGNLELTLDRGNQSDPIFVFKAGGNLPTRFGTPRVAATRGPVKLTLKGVDPNNIFWASNSIVINDYPHELTGNFFGFTSATINAPSQTEAVIKGGRLLGFNTATGLSGKMTAMTTTAEPLLVPVLQLHSPKGSPSNNTQTAFGGPTDHLNDDWLPHAVNPTNASNPVTFNAALVMGDTPARPKSSDGRYLGETNGGLGNFPRFLEAWEERDNVTLRRAKIFGSLIQFKKSEFATAPFQAIDNPSIDTSLFFDDANPAYTANYVERDYRYKGGSNARQSPYYRAPERQWGYDVGFLSQTADLFSRRFGTPSAGTPSEFYRSVGRDDPWVQTLLCAAEPSGTGTPTYDTRAIPDDRQRPANCPTLPYAQPTS